MKYLVLFFVLMLSSVAMAADDGQYATAGTNGSGSWGGTVVVNGVVATVERALVTAYCPTCTIKWTLKWPLTNAAVYCPNPNCAKHTIPQLVDMATTPVEVGPASVIATYVLTGAVPAQAGSIVSAAPSAIKRTVIKP